MIMQVRNVAQKNVDYYDTPSYIVNAFIQEDVSELRISCATAIFRDM